MLSTYSKRTAKSLVFKAVVACISIGIPVCVAYATTGSLTGSIAKEVDTSHINPKMQSIAENEINKAVKQYHAQSGVIAIADPATGNILAFAEVNQNKNQRSWRSRVFSPGSTIKPFIAAAAIESGSSSETKSYDCRSPYSINGTSFTNVSSVQSASLGEAMTQSINVCFIKVSQEAGAAVVRNKLKDFGFDMNTWWQANQGEQLQLAKAALGENIPVTIASLIQSYAILANNGRSLGGGETAVITTATSKTINHMLEHAVLKGTGEAAHIPGIAVAGKTGTVVENKKNHLALFAGYMPVNSPRYVLLVVIEGGAVQHKTEILTSGGALAAPVFRQVVVNILQNTHQ